jgi:hypothetical protein
MFHLQEIKISLGKQSIYHKRCYLEDVNFWMPAMKLLQNKQIFSYVKATVEIFSGKIVPITGRER